MGWNENRNNNRNREEEGIRAERMKEGEGGEE